MKEEAPLTVGRLIDSYRRDSGDPPRREDERHAQWWAVRLGREPVSALTVARLCGELDRLASRNRSPSTVAFYLRFLRRVTAWGAQCAYLPHDPCAGMALPKERTPPMRVLTADEENALCSALGPPYSLWVKLALLTGLKQSEQFTLRWREVDLDRATLLLPHTTTGALSSLRLAPEAVVILRSLRQMQPPSLWVFPDSQTPFRAVNIHAFYVGRWPTAVHRAGIPWLAWKDLRHTCGVRLAQHGHSVHDIARFLRQRELRQAYLYRAWRPDVPWPRRGVRPAAPSVFPELGDGELQRTLLRDGAAPPLTLGEACRLYAVHHLKRRPSRLQFDRIYRQCFACWQERPLAALARREVRAWYAGLAHVPSHANKALTFLRSVCNWAVDMELVRSENPTLRIKRYPEPPRERVLTVDEAQRFMDGLPHVPVRQRAYLLLLLLTGARKSEARELRWEQIDEPARLWRKPRTKNGTSHVVPLPAQAMEALQQLPRLGPWVFSGLNGRPWCAGTVDKFWAVIRRRWGLDDVTLHDLRRTCASYLAMHGENLPTIQNVLNHRSLNPTSIYARLNTQAVDRALQDQADRLCRLTGDHEVLPLPRTPLPGRPRLQLVGRDTPSPADESGTQDLALARLIEKAWNRLPASLQERYTAAAAALGVPFERLAEDAIEWHVGPLEQIYGVASTL